MKRKEGTRDDQTDRFKKAGVVWTFQKIWKEARGCSRASGEKKNPTNPTKNSHKQAKPEEDWIKNTSQEEKQG